MGKAKILIVEDEYIIALCTQKRLELQGHLVTGIASTAEQALKKIRQEKPNIVLMDIKLAGELDGIKAAQKIKDQFDDILLIFTSAYSDEKIIERAKSTQPFAFIFKTSTYDDLFDTIQKAVDHLDSSSK